MKTLTLTEPWATLMALGEKTIETRSWRIPEYIIGEEVAIHAAKGMPRWALDLCFEEPFISSLGRGYDAKLTRGRVLCTVKFTGCVLTSSIRTTISEKERAFGDYSDGRFAWFSERVFILQPPVLAIGHLGFWEWVHPHA